MKNYDDMLRCIRALESTWKSVYGPGTQYVGYMTVDMAITILSARRYLQNTIDWDQEKLNNGKLKLRH